MSAVLAAPPKRVVLEGFGGRISLPPSVLIQELDRAIAQLVVARLYLRSARTGACCDSSVIYPVDVALIALKEAFEAVAARRAALGGL